MTKDIKTKNVAKNIKTLDKAATATQHIRQASVKSKQQIEENTNYQEKSPQTYAINKVSKKVPQHTKGIIMNAKKNEKQLRIHLNEKKRAKAVKTEKAIIDVHKMPQQKRILSFDKEHYKRQMYYPDRKALKAKRSASKSSKTGRSKNIKHITKISKHEKVSAKLPSQNKNAAKQHAIHSVRKSKETAAAMKSAAWKPSGHVKKTTHAAASALRKMIESAKEVYVFLAAIGSIAVFFILIIALIGGIFMTGGSSSSENTQLSQEVIDHTPLIQKYAEEYEIPTYVNAIQAIMMQESVGRGNDPMQSSECAFNKEYPNKPNGITDPEYSIKVGVENFADCIKRANCEDPFDIEHLYLAWQGYNYGNNYIEWAVENFGGYSQGNALMFSEQQAAKNGWLSYGDPEYVPHVARYYQFTQMGTGSSEIVNIAISQLGNKGGIPYWSWWGYQSRVEWCAIFISWCADQCGMIDDGSILKFENVTVGMEWFKERDQWLPNDVTPSESMVIFFDWNNDSTCDHVGLVEKAENGTVYTIEGNSGDEVKRNTYPLNSDIIMGYGTIKDR